MLKTFATREHLELLAKRQGVQSRPWTKADVAHLLGALRKIAESDDAEKETKLLQAIRAVFGACVEGIAVFRDSTVPANSMDYARLLDWHDDHLDPPLGPASTDHLAAVSLGILRAHFGVIRKHVCRPIHPETDQIKRRAINAKECVQGLISVKSTRRRMADDAGLMLGLIRFGAKFGQRWPHAMFDCINVVYAMLLEHAKPFQDLPFKTRGDAMKALSKTTKAVAELNVFIPEDISFISQRMGSLMYYSSTPAERERLSGLASAAQPGLKNLDLDAIHSDLDGRRTQMKEINSVSDSCDRCGAEEKERVVTLRRCARCRVARYCSRECQAAAWSDGSHKKVCYAADVDS